jgi:hypothetical protein
METILKKFKKMIVHTRKIRLVGRDNKEALGVGRNKRSRGVVVEGGGVF